MRFRKIVLTPSLIEEFNARVNPVGSGCWLWTGARRRRGYGSIYSAEIGSELIASRVALTIAKGPIPDGLEACHTCDNPPCVNPAHLFAGTRGDNLRDMVAKGRHRRPNSSPSPFCPSGHEFTPENTRLYAHPRGWTERRCRICARLSARVQEQRRQRFGRKRNRRVA